MFKSAESTRDHSKQAHYLALICQFTGSHFKRNDKGVFFSIFLKDVQRTDPLLRHAIFGSNKMFVCHFSE